MNNKEDIEQAISVVLANYTYADFNVISNKQLVIGEKEGFPLYYWGSMSNEDIQTWRSPNDEKIYIGLRGTSTLNHVIKTWPVIATSLERAEYMPYFDHFNKQTKAINDTLKIIGITPNEYNRVVFVGHSMGGTSARIQAERFPSSRASVYNQGSGIMTNPSINKLTNKLLKTLISNHVGQVVKVLAASLSPYLSPLGITTESSEYALASITKAWANNQLTYTQSSNFVNQPFVEAHRSKFDPVSALSYGQNNTKSYDINSSPFNILQNHAIEPLLDIIKNQTGFPDLKVETAQIIAEEITTHIKSKRKDHYDLLKNGMFTMNKNNQSIHYDLSLQTDINNTQNLIRISRENFRCGLNKFNMV